jgi:hypothetical protein
MDGERQLDERSVRLRCLELAVEQTKSSNALDNEDTALATKWAEFVLGNKAASSRAEDIS